MAAGLRFPSVGEKPVSFWQHLRKSNRIFGKLSDCSTDLFDFIGYSPLNGKSSYAHAGVLSNTKLIASKTLHLITKELCTVANRTIQSTSTVLTITGPRLESIFRTQTNCHTHNGQSSAQNLKNMLAKCHFIWRGDFSKRAFQSGTGLR